MSLVVEILQGGANSHGVTVDDFNAIATDFVSNGVVGTITLNTGSGGTGSFAVNAQETPDNTVAVSAGQAYFLGTPTAGTSQRLRVVNSASANVTIAANSTGATRYDKILIKLDAAKMADPAIGADDVATLITERHTAAGQAVTEAFAYELAEVTVANLATTFANATISDSREQSTVTAAVADGSITNAKLSTTSGEPGGVEKAYAPTLTNLTATTKPGFYTQVGKKVTYSAYITSTSSSAGVISVSLPLQAKANGVKYWGTAFGGNTGTSYHGGIAQINSDGITVTFYSGGTSTAQWGATVPFTWASGSILGFTITYEAA